MLLEADTQRQEGTFEKVPFTAEHCKKYPSYKKMLQIKVVWNKINSKNSVDAISIYPKNGAKGRQTDLCFWNIMHRNGRKTFTESRDLIE